MRYWEKNSNTGVLKFYGRIGEWWNGADDFTNTFKDLEAKYANIEIRVHCYGGSVFEGSVMYNVIDQSKANVTVIIDGVAASMMSIVMLPAKKIIMANNAFVMVHRPTIDAGGNADEMFTAGKLLKAMEKNFIAAYIKKTGKPESFVKAWLDGLDHWMSADECKANGLVDEIMDPVVTDVAQMSKPDITTPMQSVYDRYAALVKDLPTNQNNNFQTMKKDLIQKFGLPGVNETSSDTAVIEAMAAHVSSIQSQLAALQNGHKAAMSGLIDNAIAQANASKTVKFTEAQIADFKMIGEKAGLPALATVLALNVETTVAASAATTDLSKMAAAEVKTAGTGAVSTNRADWNFDKWQKEDPDGLEALAESNYDAFNAIYKAKFKTDAPR